MNTQIKFNRRTGQYESRQITQTAIDHVHGSPCKTPELLAALPAESEGHLGRGRRLESGNTTRGFGLSKAQQISMHAAAVERRDIRNFEAGVFAQEQLRRHIRKSLPGGQQTKKTTFLGSLHAVHHIAAGFAFRQALRSVHRLHLKHLADTQGFVEDCCSWYQKFCRLMGWVYRAAGKNTVANKTDIKGL